MSAVRLRSSTKASAEKMLALQLQAGDWQFATQFKYVEGRKFAADFVVYSKTGDDAVLVEVQGGIYSKRAHGSVTGVLADIDRLNEATIARWRLLRVTPDMVDSGAAITLIERAFR